MAPACFAAAGHGRPQRVAAPVPVAWLESDALAEYLRFLEEAAPPAPPPVAWLEGEVRDEFLRFLEESRAAAAAAGPDRQQQEEHGRGGDESDDDGGLVADDDHRSSVDGSAGFMDDDDGDVVGDDAVAMEDDREDGGAVTGRDDEDAEAVLELLLPHILDLPAFRARAAAAAPPEPAQQEPALGFPCDEGGWMQMQRGGVCLIDADSCCSCYSSDQEMSSREEEIEEGTSVCT